MAIYDAWTKATMPPENVPIWGFAYDIDNETGRSVLKAEPVLGEICWSGTVVRNRYFFPYKKGTHEKRKTGEVHYTSRYYADTEAEAKQAYNKLVDDRIRLLNKMALDAEKDKLK